MKMTKLLTSTAFVAALMLSTSLSGASFAAGMADLARALQADYDVPVIDGVSAAVKQAEALVSQGLMTSKRGAYASPLSKEGHVNCKSAPDLKRLMQRHFHDVFIFSMNDEVVHTGFYALAHYLFALCVGKRS